MSFCACLGRAVSQNFVHVIQIRREFGAFFPRFGKVIPVVLEKHLLQVAIAEAASAQTVFKIFGYVWRGNEFEQLDGEIFVRIGLWFLPGSGCP